MKENSEILSGEYRFSQALIKIIVVFQKIAIMKFLTITIDIEWALNTKIITKIIKWLLFDWNSKIICKKAAHSYLVLDKKFSIGYLKLHFKFYYLSLIILRIESSFGNVAFHIICIYAKPTHLIPQIRKNLLQN